jgi:HAD superfamily hydrolase (TIGR01509 family)
LVAKKRREFAKFLESHLKILPGVPELLADLDKNQIPFGICSGAIRSEIEFVLRQADLLRYFRFIVAADDISKSKPDPEPYLLSMQVGREFVNGNRELTPLQCVAVEDSVGGIRAAKAAGMACLAVTNSYPADQLRHADHVVDELTEVDADFFRQLIKIP